MILGAFAIDVVFSLMGGGPVTLVGEPAWSIDRRQSGNKNHIIATRLVTLVVGWTWGTIRPYVVGLL